MHVSLLVYIISHGETNDVDSTVQQNRRVYKQLNNVLVVEAITV